MANKFKFKNDPYFLANYIAYKLYTLDKGSRITPIQLMIFPTALCDDKCAYCDRIDPEEKPKTELFKDKKIIDRLVDDIKSLKIRDIHIFGGGEPFLYKENMFYFLEKLKNTDVFIRVITNTNNLNNSDIKYIVKNNLLGHLNISLNSDSEKTSILISSKKNRHTHTLSILKSIKKYKTRYNSQFPKVDILLALINLNYDKIHHVLRQLKSLNINNFQMQPLRVSTNFQKRFRLSQEEEKKFLDSLPEIKRLLDECELQSNVEDFKHEALFANSQSLQKIMRYPELKNEKGVKIKCITPLVNLMIYSDGRILKCRWLDKEFYSLNYFDMKSLKELIISDEYISFTNRMINGKLPESCKDCRICMFHEVEDIKQFFNNTSKRITIDRLEKSKGVTYKGYNLRYDYNSVLNEMVCSLNNLSPGSIHKYMPKQLMILPNIGCNSRCVYCCIKRPMESKEIFQNRKIIDNVLNDIKKIGYTYINIVGGEPFFYKQNMLYFLEQLKGLDCFVVVNTNLTLLGQDDLKRIIKNELISCLNISLNSDSDELEYKISGNKDRHSRTVRNLALINYYKKKYNTKIPNIVIMFAMFNLNYRSVLNVLNQVKDYGISGFIVQPMRVYAEEDKKLKLNELQKKEFLKMVPEMSRIAKEYKLYSWLDDFLKEDLIDNAATLQNINKYKQIHNKHGVSFSCHFPMLYSVIDWDGKVFGCPFSREHVLSFDYTKDGSLQEFLKSEDYNLYRNQFINRRSIPKICKNCQICEINQVRKFHNLFEKEKAK